MRICSKCKKEKSLSEFYKDKSSKDGYCCWCKKCKDKSTKKFRKKNPEWQQNYMKEYHLKNNYDISYEDFLNLYNEQNGQCGICKKYISIDIDSEKHLKANVDHNHTNKKVRGLLCENCNRAIGLLEDNITNLYNAIEYLK